MNPKDLNPKDLMALLLGETCDALDELMADIESRMGDPASLRGLNEVEADLMASTTIHGVVGNGGFVYWYERSDHAHTERAALAFERMGARDVAELVRSTLAGLPDDPSEYVVDNREELETRFAARDKEMWLHNRRWPQLAARHVIANEKLLGTNRTRKKWIERIRTWLDEHPRLA
jgi:hypothetical protein